MKLSVLIPVFNADCRPLVSELCRQMFTSCHLSQADGEILVADDCSTCQATKLALAQMDSWQGCKVIWGQQNVGRAAIRNRLARHAKGEYLLFIDCDARIDRPDFISQYLHHAHGQAMVCGGTANLKQCPGSRQRLRWRCDRAVEQRLTPAWRNRHPYDSITTFNFMVRRDLFLSILFSERIHAYGHEDTLFGLELKRRGTAILHIDNKLTHLGIEPAHIYLAKVEQSINVLATMPTSVQQQIRLSRCALRLSHLHILWLARLHHTIFGAAERKLLCTCLPSPTLLNIYKLGFISLCMHATHHAPSASANVPNK